MALEGTPLRPRVTAAITGASLLVLLLAWIAATSLGLVDDLFLPGPGLLWAGFLDLLENGYRNRSIWEHAGWSLERVLAGFLTGSLVGTLLGLGMGVNRKIEAIFSPLVEFFRPLPQLAYLVLLIVWFGIGETAQIVLLFLTALPVSAIAAMDGVRNVSVQRIQAARSLGATEWQIFRYVVFPSALHEIFTGARLAIGVVYATLIAAEIISGSTGIGWMILDAGRFLRSDYVFVGILFIGIVGLGLDRLLLLVEHRVVHWSGKD
ncbi:MAG TPA: ABC transporter permease [Stellaceae bacterium]|nr:ABC transporter permease [Stellaceae bacterium]